MLDNECIFCKILKGDIPSSKVYEDEYVLGFRDISPVTPVHVLVVPKIHIKNVNEINEENAIYLEKIFKAIKEVAKVCNVAESGYRVITNCGKDAGQTVEHLHFHVLGGECIGEKLI